MSKTLASCLDASARRAADLRPRTTAATVPLAGGDLDSELEEEVKDGGNPAANPLSKQSTMREDVFSLTEGKATIQWPTPLSPDSIQDLKDWLKIAERKISRSTTEQGQADGSR